MKKTFLLYKINLTNTNAQKLTKTQRKENKKTPQKKKNKEYNQNTPNVKSIKSEIR